MIGILRRLLGRRVESEADAPSETEADFGKVLEQAVQRSGDPRRAQVARLAAHGVAVGSIARDTRLARDAVRTVLGSS